MSALAALTQSIENFAQQAPGIPVARILEHCLKTEGLHPTDPKWQPCLSKVYQTLEILGKAPTLAAYSQAIYDMWSSSANVPEIEKRVTCKQMTAGLESVENKAGGKAYSSADVDEQAKAFYLEITISIEAAGLLQHLPNVPGGGQQVYSGDFVTLTDNQPEKGIDEGKVELDSEGLTPNMTIHWTAVTTAPHSIQLVKFENNDPEDWKLIAPPALPVPGQPNEFMTKTNPVLQPNDRAQYSFYYKVDNGPVTYYFDPFVGDRKA